MIYAIDENGKKIRATTGAKGVCNLCGSELIARCGQIRVHHWAHRIDANCDIWGEPESDWHREWKLYAHPENCEVVVGEHRADILTPDGIVIELQNSPISSETIVEREDYYIQYYKFMIWIVNVESIYSHFSFHFPSKEYRKGAVNFWWNYPRRSWYLSNRPVFFDFGNKKIMVGKYEYSGANYLLLVRRFNEYKSHSGLLVKKTNVIRRYFQGVPSPFTNRIYDACPVHGPSFTIAGDCVKCAGVVMS